MKKSGKNKTSSNTAGITGQVHEPTPVNNTLALSASKRKPQEKQKCGYGIHKTAPNKPVKNPVGMVRMDLVTTLSFAVTDNDGLMCQQTC